MTHEDITLIAESIWRSGYIKDKNKIRQTSREKMRHLIAVDLASSLKTINPHFDTQRFLTNCGPTY